MSVEVLLELGKKKFGKSLTDADKKLFGTTAGGKVAYYGAGDPADADTWGEDRVLRADRIEWLCTDPEAVKEVTHQGVQIKGARIEGVLQLSYAKLDFPLSIQNSAVPKGMVFERAHLVELILTGTHTGPIIGDGLSVEQDLHMRNGFQVSGEVRLVGAKIGGNLECDNSQFSNPNGYALCADGVDVKGSVFLQNQFQATGEVRLLEAKIGGHLVCIKGHFSNPNGTALDAGGVVVKGSVFLREQFQAKGLVDFIGATVTGHFILQKARSPELCTLRLESARIGTLWDEKDSWPAKLYLDGLVYDRLDNDAPVGWKERLEWIERQDYKEPCKNKFLRFLAKRAPSDGVRNAIFALDSYRRTKKKFVPQPYVQLAKVLKEMGHEGDAKNILIEKERAHRQFGKLGIRGWVWNRVLDKTIRYGYRTHRALFVLLVFLASGTDLFNLADRRELMWPSKERVYMTKGLETPRDVPEAYPVFSAFVYSLDTLIPLVELHQQGYWLPNANKGCERFGLTNGAWLRVYLWVHIGVGWVFTTLAVAGFTGLVRRE